MKKVVEHSLRKYCCSVNKVGLVKPNSDGLLELLLPTHIAALQYPPALLSSSSKSPPLADASALVDCCEMDRQVLDLDLDRP